MPEFTCGPSVYNSAGYFGVTLPAFLCILVYIRTTPRTHLWTMILQYCWHSVWHIEAHNKYTLNEQVAQISPFIAKLV